MFNITHIENIENVKYSTKNNNINDNEVFLAIKNHINAIISSKRNLMLTLTSVYNGWLLASFFRPSRKIINVIDVTAQNDRVSKIISEREILIMKSK